MRFAIPTQPEVFLKPASCLAGATDTIVLPRPHHQEVDYEVELAVVLGRECKDATEENALSFVLGYTAANDLTTRDVQRLCSQWSYCKGFDGFCPLGPALIAAASVPDLSELDLQSKLELLQASVFVDKGSNSGRNIPHRNDFITIADIWRIEKGIRAESVRLHLNDGISTQKWAASRSHKHGLSLLHQQTDFPWTANCP